MVSLPLHRYPLPARWAGQPGLLLHSVHYLVEAELQRTHRRPDYVVPGPLVYQSGGEVIRHQVRY